MNLGIQKTSFLQRLSRILGTDECKTLERGKRKKGNWEKAFFRIKKPLSCSLSYFYTDYSQNCLVCSWLYIPRTQHNVDTNYSTTVYRPMNVHRLTKLSVYSHISQTLYLGFISKTRDLGYFHSMNQTAWLWFVQSIERNSLPIFL